MTDVFQHFFTRYPIKTRRLLEILPGFFSWSLILFPVWGALLIPIVVSYFVLFYDVYWFYKSFSLVIIAFIAHRKITASEKQDFVKKAKELAHFEKIYHLIIIPNFQERTEKLRKTLSYLSHQTFPHQRLLVVLAMEEREKDVEIKTKILVKEFGKKFGGLYITFHKDMEDEVRGKSSNQRYAIEWVQKYVLSKKRIDKDFLTISSVDADSLFDHQYFAYLSYVFLKDTNPYRRFWQSATVYHNNIWQVPAPIRILSIIGSVWRTGVLIRHERLIPNATYSTSFKLLKQVGFWDKDVIPEDYRIFFKAFYKTGGEIEVVPIFLKTSMDAAQSTGFWKSLKNKYEQEKRWAWGVSDDPLFIKWWLTVPKISFWKKTNYLLRVLMDHFLWPVNWFIITIAANVISFVNPQFTRTTLGYNLPRLSGVILTSCLLALMAIIIIDQRQRRASQGPSSKLRELLVPFEFVMIPIASFFLSTLPGLVAHTRLMLGKRMDYRVTEKV